MDGQTLTWIQILQVGGLAGVVSALFSGGVKEFFEWQERKRRARFLALSLSLLLEDYYQACIDRIYSIENFISSRGNAGSNDIGLPKIAAYPTDPVVWVYLDQVVVDEVLSLPATIKAEDESIKFNVDIDNMPGEPNPEWTLEPLYEMAFRAIKLAKRIRSKHGLSETTRTKESENRLKVRQQDFLQKMKEERDRYKVVPQIL